MFFCCQLLIFSGSASSLAFKEHVLHLNLIVVKVEQYWIVTVTGSQRDEDDVDLLRNFSWFSPECWNLRISLQNFIWFHVSAGSTYLHAGALCGQSFPKIWKICKNVVHLYCSEFLRLSVSAQYSARGRALGSERAQLPHLVKLKWIKMVPCSYWLQFPK